MENKVTKSIMVGASLVLALTAVALIFSGEEWCRFFEVETNPALLIVLQILGGFMAGFAILNWMSKGMTLGGIYGRPIVLANFLHFFMNGIVLLKLATKNDSVMLWIAAVVSSILAAAFGRLMFGRVGE